MNFVINKLSTPTYKNISFQGRNNQPKIERNNNSTRNILLYSLIALASLSIPTETKANTNIENIDTYKDIKDENAVKMNLTSTPNENIYFDKQNNKYYIWNNKKQIFDKAKNVDSVLKTGFIKTKKGSYLDQKGNMFVENVNGKILCPSHARLCDISYAMAKVFGYEKTSISNLDVFYDKENEQYLKWDKEKQAWGKSQVTDVSPNGNFLSNGKAYRALYSGQEEISKKEFYADKQNLYQTDVDTIFIDKDINSDKEYFVWHNDSEQFEEFGPKTERKRMLVNKADGKIDEFVQGSIGDCWLLSAINGLKRHSKGREILEKSLFVDKDNNITVTLQGPKKQYTFTKEQIDSVLNKSGYYYSTGDRDVLAIEMAVEKFKTETAQKSSKRVTNMYNYYIPPTQEDMPLEGGHAYNSLHLLTGMQSNRVNRTYAPNVILTNDTASVGQLDEEKIQKILDNSNNIVIAEYRTPDSGHAVVLSSMDKDNVYVIDSDISAKNPNRKVVPTPIDKKEFFDKLINITYTDLSKPITEKLSHPTRANIITTEDARKIIGGNVYL